MTFLAALRIPFMMRHTARSLNEKIKKRYYFREIGYETAELFIWHLDRLLNEIMPYYNEMYKSQLLLIDAEF